MDDITVVEPTDITVATQTIQCPHNRALTIRNVLGAIAYYHKDDDKSCFLMNRLETGASPILSAMVTSTGFADTPATRAAVVTAGDARQAIYAYLSKLTGQHLADALSRLLVVYSKTTIQDTLIQELVSTFGLPVVTNIQVICGEDYSKFLETRGKNKKQKSDYMHMTSLKAHDVQVATKTYDHERRQRAQDLQDLLDASRFTRGR